MSVILAEMVRTVLTVHMTNLCVVHVQVWWRALPRYLPRASYSLC